MLFLPILKQNIGRKSRDFDKDMKKVFQIFFIDVANGNGRCRGQLLPGRPVRRHGEAARLLRQGSAAGPVQHVVWRLPVDGGWRVAEGVPLRGVRCPMLRQLPASARPGLAVFVGCGEGGGHHGICDSFSPKLRVEAAYGGENTVCGCAHQGGGGG